MFFFSHMVISSCKTAETVYKMQTIRGAEIDDAKCGAEDFGRKNLVLNPLVLCSSSLMHFVFLLIQGIPLSNQQISIDVPILTLFCCIAVTS